MSIVVAGEERTVALTGDDREQQAKLNVEVGHGGARQSDPMAGEPRNLAEMDAESRSLSFSLSAAKRTPGPRLDAQRTT